MTPDDVDSCVSDDEWSSSKFLFLDLAANNAGGDRSNCKYTHNSKTQKVLLYLTLREELDPFSNCPRKMLWPACIHSCELDCLEDGTCHYLLIGVFVVSDLSGIIPAPLTFGLSVPINAGIGSISGMIFGTAGGHITKGRTETPSLFPEPVFSEVLPAHMLDDGVFFNHPSLRAR